MDAKELAWARVVRERKQLDQLFFVAFGFAIAYVAVIGIFDIQVSHITNVLVALSVIAAKYYAGYKSDQLEKDYYKEFPPS